MDKFIFPLIIMAVLAFLYFRNSASNEAAKENILIGEKFLLDNRGAEGIQETASGIQYQVLNKGTGNTHPGPKDQVRVHYHGTLIDGIIFDSSVDRGTPISFGLNQVIPGWREAVQLMVVSEKTRFFIPSRLAYGNKATGKISPGSLLIFEIELLGINE